MMVANLPACKPSIESEEQRLRRIERAMGIYAKCRAEYLRVDNIIENVVVAAAESKSNGRLMWYGPGRYSRS
jgi:hypothetical protein